MRNARSVGRKAVIIVFITLTLTGAFPAAAFGGANAGTVLDIVEGAAAEHLLAVAEIGTSDIAGEGPATIRPPETCAFMRFQIPVSLGWNLISFPLVVNSTSIPTVLNDCGGNTKWDVVKWYDPLTPSDPWKTYRPNGTANDLSVVNNSQGLWVNITEVGDGALVVEGAPPTTSSISIMAGWNLVGYPSLEPRIAADALAGVTYDIIQGFSPTCPYIRDVPPTETLCPGRGYWIRATCDCIWNVGDATPPGFVGLVSAINLGTGGSVALSWNAAIDPSYPITYNVYMATTPDGQDYAAPSYTTQDTNIGIDGLTNGQPYYFVARAADSAGNEDTNTVQKSAIPTLPAPTAPQIIETVPADGAAGISTARDILITFSESIDKTAFACSCSPDPGGWSAAWSTATFPNDRVTLTHADFASGVQYTFTVTDVQDLDGTPLVAGPAQNPWSFTTVAAQDEAGPTVSDVAAAPDPVSPGETLTLAANASDAGTGNADIAAVEWSLGADAAAAGSGTPMGANDGSFDSPMEIATASIDTAGWPLGINILWVRGCDAFGNWGSPVSTAVTAAMTDTVPPQIVATVPASGSAGVAAAQAIVVRFSESMDTTSFAFSCTPDPGGWVLAWSAAEQVNDSVTLTHADFAYSAEHTITVTSAEDLVWNALAPGSIPNPWTFTTAAAPDMTSPFITSTSPAGDSAGVAITQSVTITFSESVDPAGFAYSCTPNLGGWAATWGTAIYTNDLVTLTHTDFAYSTAYTLTVTAAPDMAGNALFAGPAPNPWTFTTATAPDTVPPQVVCNTPADGAAGVTVSSFIVVEFTEAMDRAKTQVAFGTAPASEGVFSWNTSDTMTFRPTANLSYSTTYTVTIQFAATDLAGNTLDGNRDGVMGLDNEDSWIFTFTTEPDIKGPIVSSVTASPNSFPAGVIFALGASVSDVNTGNSDVAAVEWSRGTYAAAAGTGTAMPSLDGSFDSPAENVNSEISSSGWSIGINTIWVRGMDAWNNWGDAVSTTVSVTALDTVPPQVVSNTPANGATGVMLTANIVVLFNEAMNRTSTQGAFSVKPTIAGTFSWNAGGDILIYNPTANLAANTKYTVTISTAATDLAGNTLDGNRNGREDTEKRDRWVFSFTTGTASDTTAPFILAATPASSAVGVAVTQNVIITFSETISTPTLMFTCAPDPGGWTVVWSTATFPDDRVTLTHTNNFGYSTIYTLWVTVARDLAGNELVHGAIANPWSFTTMVNPDTAGPVVSDVAAAPNPVTRGGSLTVTAIISDVLTGNSNIAMAEWSHGTNATAAGFGTPMTASDSLYNSPTELVISTISTTGWTEGVNTIWVRARDSANNWGSAASASVTVIASINRYAVCVGINTYAHQSSLTYCINDASECGSNLFNAGYSVNLLIDESATKANILAALDNMGAGEVAGDYTAFTYSGHGGTSGGIYFICPTDGYFFEEMITADEFEAKFAGYQSTHQLIFFDSCNSGGMAPLGSAGRLCIMASDYDEYSWDGQTDLDNGVWTYYFWESGYRKGGAGSAVLESVFTYAKPLASSYVLTCYSATMTPQIADGYTGSFYL